MLCAGTHTDANTNGYGNAYAHPMYGKMRTDTAPAPDAASAADAISVSFGDE